MPRLTTERYLQARAFLNDHARPLELALFEHDFEGAPAWPVLGALAVFQNDDGGFGHGLEPDSQSPSSGALATSVALRILAELGAPPSHPLVRSACDYLMKTFDAVRGVWRIVPDDTQAHPHAPWWRQEGLEERFNGFRFNPKCEIIAHLNSLAAPVDRLWLQEQTSRLVDEVVAACESEAGIEMHDLIGARRLLDAVGLRDGERPRLQAALTRAAEAHLNAAGDAGYGLRALDMAPLPASTLAAELGDRVVAELEAVVTSQAADGAWWANWDWGAESDSAAAKAWAQSRVAWAGVITLDNLRLLSAHDLLDRG